MGGIDRRGFLGSTLKGSLNDKVDTGESGGMSVWGAFATVAGVYALMRIIGALGRSERQYKIELVEKTLEFASNELGISVTNLIDFDAPIIPGVYGVGATARDSLDGFLQAHIFICPHCAEGVARFLPKGGFDVFMTQHGVAGNVDGPLTRTLLANSPVEIVNSILEAAFFQYIHMSRIEVPTNYMLQIITYIGLKGAIEFSAKEPQLREEAEAQLQRRLKQSELIKRYCRELTDCYSGRGGQKRQILKRARKDWFKLEEPLLYGSKFLSIINNAFFYYHRAWAIYFDEVVEVLSKCSIKKYLSQPDGMNKLLVEKCAGKAPY